MFGYPSESDTYIIRMITNLMGLLVEKKLITLEEAKELIDKAHEDTVNKK